MAGDMAGGKARGKDGGWLASWPMVMVVSCLCGMAMFGGGCSASGHVGHATVVEAERSGGEPYGAAHPQRFEFTRLLLGVEARIVLFAEEEAAANHAARAAYDAIAAVDAVMSDYRVDSELMLLRGRPAGMWITLSEDLWRVLRTAQQISAESDGAFDVTISPLTQLWRAARRSGELPEASTLAAARARVGYRMMEVDPDEPRVRFAREEMALDLGGIGKGYAADRAADALRGLGVARFMVDLGGDIVLSAPPPGQDGWRVGIARIEQDESMPIIKGQEMAVAMSGGSMQLIEIEGGRYAHVIDPRSGFGLRHRFAVTVVAPTGKLADGYASALSVLEPQMGLALAMSIEGVEAMIEVERDGVIEVHKTPGWPGRPAGESGAGDR